MRYLTLLLLLVWSVPAFAQPAPPAPPPPSSEPTDPGAQAVQLGRSAIARYDKGQWQRAYDDFAQANAVFPSPVFVVYMARCKRELGDLLTARKLFRSVSQRLLPEGAPAPWRKAKEDASNELERLMIPTLTVIAARDVRVRVNGSEQPIGVATEHNPGEVRVEALRADEVVISRVVTLTAPMTIELEDPTATAGPPAIPGPATAGPLATAGPPAIPGPATAGPPAIAGAPQHPPADSPEALGPVWPGAACLTLGVAGLVSGIATGVVATSKADEVKARCLGNDCLLSDEALKDDAVALAHVSTVSFVVGAAASAVGVTLLITRPGGIEVAASPTGVRLVGRFH